MEELLNYSVIEEQSFLYDFCWNEMNFNTYLVKFRDYTGYYKLNREISYNQDLLGAKITFNVNDDLTKISKYKLVGYEKVENKRKKVIK
jgi:hypothetical protein